MEQEAGGGPGPRASAAALLQRPAPARGIRVAAGASRCARGGARAASAGSPGGGEGGGTPSPKSPGGGAARRLCAREAKLGSGARGFASCVWEEEGDGPLPSWARPPALGAAEDLRG